MSLRLDPRRLSALKRLAAEAGLRPGEMARQWIEERIDGERSGAGAPRAPTPATGAGLDEFRTRLDRLTERLAALESASRSAASDPVAIEVSAPATGAPAAEPTKPAAEAAPARRRGRPRKVGATVRATPARSVPLHEEIAAVISERGPSTAAEIAVAIGERGRYSPPRTGKPLDAAMVNGRVSNPVYRSRFVRNDGRIGLAEPIGG